MIRAIRLLNLRRLARVRLRTVIAVIAVAAGSSLALSVLIAVATIWLAIVAAYVSNWPIGFFVGTLGAGFFIAARGWAAWRRRRVVSGRRASPDEFLVGGVES